MRIALGIEYDGSVFSGWQSQAHGDTVQDALERALQAIAGAPLRVNCAGRTDAGVHALVQVVHFDSSATRPLNAWVRGVNRYLPAAVAVRWAAPVADEFHARFAAISRSYRYVLVNREVRPALGRAHVGWYHVPLDVDLMRQAAEQLLGEHDFSAFRDAQCQAKSPVKIVRCAEVARYGDYVVFEIQANAFLHHMVRNIVGALVYIGKGRYPPEWLGELLASADRRQGAPTFPAAGLYLCGIEYAAHWRLPQNGRIIAPLFLPAA